MNHVIGGIDMVKDFTLFSDKCGVRELQKTNDEFQKDLKKLRYKTRVSVWKYIKDPDAKGGNAKENNDDDDDDEDSVPVKKESANYDNTVS